MPHVALPTPRFARTTSVGTLLAATLALGAAPSVAASAPPEADLAAAFTPSFDPVASPEPTAVALPDGSDAWVVDTGPEDGIPVLFVGGTGTSATAVSLVEFQSSARETLGIRLISIDRNGYGQAAFDPAAGYADFADSALAVLDTLGVTQFSTVAISGGGPYAMAVATAAPDRIRSLHLAAAYTGDPIAGTIPQICAADAAAQESVAAMYADDPAGWWAQPDDASVHQIPGWFDAAVADATRTFQVTDGHGNPDGLTHEFGLFCTPTTPGSGDVDVSGVAGPAFLYYGADDTTVPFDYADQFAEWLPNVAADRRFEGSAHDVQYRHWGQVLVDIASPERPVTLACADGVQIAVETSAVPDGATLDSCAWAG